MFLWTQSFGGSKVFTSTVPTLEDLGTHIFNVLLLRKTATKWRLNIGHRLVSVATLLNCHTDSLILTIRLFFNIFKILQKLKNKNYSSINFEQLGNWFKNKKVILKAIGASKFLQFIVIRVHSKVVKKSKKSNHQNRPD